MTLDLGYLIGTAIFAVLFVVGVAAQISARRYHPLLYWAVIVATTTAGTTLADLFDRSLGIGYSGGSLSLFALLIATLALWYHTLGSVSVDSIASPKAEAFYWATIMFSQTLGTAFGDWMADTGLGYEGGALVFAAALAVVTGLYFFTAVSRTFLFWGRLHSHQAARRHGGRLPGQAARKWRFGPRPLFSVGCSRGLHPRVYRDLSATRGTASRGDPPPLPELLS